MFHLQETCNQIISSLPVVCRLVIVRLMGLTMRSVLFGVALASSRGLPVPVAVVARLLLLQTGSVACHRRQ